MAFQQFFKNTSSLIKLASPILVTQLIQNLVGFIDTVMAGRVSAVDLAAVAIASSIWLPIILTIYGLIMALASIVAEYAGRKQFAHIVQASQQTLWIALSLSLLLILSFSVAIPLLTPYITLEENLTTLTVDYLWYVVWGAPGFCIFMVLRNCAEGLSITKPAMYISIIGLIINIPLNYVFIYGEFGVPSYGGAGCGIATAIVYWLMCILMLLYIYFAKDFKTIKIFQHFPWPNLSQIKHILIIGVPIALSLLFEVSLFSVVAIIIAPFGADVVASHQIALNFSGLVFMIPLSFAMAVTVKVGFALGENNHLKAKEICRHSYIFALLVAILTATLTLVFKTQIATIYTNDPKVIELAASLMFLAALFQFSDAIQVISAGALRGYKDTKAILLITFISYWLVGLTVGYLLGVTNIVVDMLGPAGFWIGFIIGLTTAAIFLYKRLKLIQWRLIHDVNA